jgi:hypothetical protein
MTNSLEKEGIEVSAELAGVGIRVQGQLVAWFAHAELAEDWARENFFGQWLAHACSMPNRPPVTLEQMEATCREGDELTGVGVRVEGQLLAWFAYPDMAAQWAEETFEQWEVHPCSIPNRPPFTPEQIEAARREAEELFKHFAPARQLGED